ncbi:4555_t:CDS:1, partial [Dentiscutata erythropus]
MNFDNFTPIEETNINSNIKSSNGITVFIPSGYFPILVRNNENVSSKDMIKELPRLNIKIPAFILNTTVNTSYNEKTLKKSPNAFMIFRSNICHVVKNKFSHLSNHQVSKLIGQLWSMLDPEVKKEYQQQAENLKKDQQKQNN